MLFDCILTFLILWLYLEEEDVIKSASVMKSVIEDKRELAQVTMTLDEKLKAESFVLFVMIFCLLPHDSDKETSTNRAALPLRPQDWGHPRFARQLT